VLRAHGLLTKQAEEEQLQHLSYSTRCCAFNRRGTLLASGCQDGTAVLWDFDTRGAVKVLQSHDPEEPGSHIVALGWSLNGRRLVTAEEKGRLRVWDVEKGEVLFAAKLDSPSLTVQISPANHDLVLACPNASVAPTPAPVWLRAHDGNSQRLALLHQRPLRFSAVPRQVPLVIDIAHGKQMPIEGAQEVAEQGDRGRAKPSADVSVLPAQRKNRRQRFWLSAMSGPAICVPFR